MKCFCNEIENQKVYPIFIKNNGKSFEIHIESDDDVKKVIYLPDGTVLETEISDITLNCPIKK